MGMGTIYENNEIVSIAYRRKNGLSSPARPNPQQ
jgi:hypothetical protein